MAVVSGREVTYLREMIGLESVTYVGNHGLVEWRTGGEQREYGVQLSDDLLEEIEMGVTGIGVSGTIRRGQRSERGGALPENSRPLSGTFRVVPSVEVSGATRGLEVKEGKMVLEIGHGPGVNKGTAVNRLAREFELTGAIVLGDDVTDCDAFDALHGLMHERGLKGAAVAVVDEETPGAVLRKADYRLSGSGEVEEFLRWMAYASPKSATKL